MHTVYIGVGCNLGDRWANITNAIKLISENPSVKVIAQSNFREYPALTRDGEEQPDYLNGVIEIKTDLGPLDLLGTLQGIERELGRAEDHGKWKPRTIDLDILTYDSLTLDTPQLTIPHPEMAKRLFVLQPLCDIAPDLMLTELKMTAKQAFEASSKP